MYRFDSFEPWMLRPYLTIDFSTEQERESFCDMLQEELEVRIGEEIMKGRTADEVDAFERASDNGDDDSLEQWLQTYRPDFGEVCESTKCAIVNEVRANRRIIPCACALSPEELEDSLLDVLDLPESIKASPDLFGLYTVGDLLSEAKTLPERLGSEAWGKCLRAVLAYLDLPSLK